MTISENSVFCSLHLEGEIIGFFPGLMQGAPKAQTLMNGSTETADVGPGFRGKLLPLGDSNPSSGSSLPTFYRRDTCGGWMCAPLRFANDESKSFWCS